MNPSASFLARVGETGDEATRDRIVAGGPDARREVVSTGRVVARTAICSRRSRKRMRCRNPLRTLRTPASSIAPPPRPRTTRSARRAGGILPDDHRCARRGLDAGEFMTRGGISLILAVASLALASCGVTPGCRAVSTGMLGAGTGAAIAAVAGGPIGLAAAIGGATGAIGGAATPPHGAYLGASPFCY